MSVSSKIELRKEQKIINEIIGIFLQLNDFSLDSYRFSDIKTRLLALEKQPQLLELFLSQIRHCKSVDVFHDRLYKLNLDQEITAPEARDITAFNSKIQRLALPMQNNAKEALQILDSVTLIEDRKIISAILDYLDRFPEQLKHEKTQWGPDYLNYINELLAPEQAVLIHVLPHINPMPYTQLLSLYHLAQKYHQGTEEDLIELIQRLDKISKKHGGKANKILSQLETLAINLNLKKDNPFILDTIEALEQWNTEEIDSFTLLLNQTQNWFYKNRFAPQYHEELFHLWHNLVNNKQQIAKLPEFISWCISLPGKSWYQVLELGLKNPNIDFSAHIPQFEQLWKASLESKKVLRHEQMQQVMSQLSLAYDIIHAIKPKDHQDIYKKELAQLKTPQLERALKCINKHEEMLKKHPKLMQAILHLISADHPKNLIILEDVIQAIEKMEQTSQKSEYKGKLIKLLTHFKVHKEEPLNHRMVLMYLLNQKLLVNHNDWSDAFNKEILEQGFNYYLLQTKELLKKRWGFNLTHQQQKALLTLTHELSLIGSDLTISTHSQSLSQQIDKLIQSSLSYYLFKPDKKNEQIMTNLKTNINEKLSASNVGYKTILNSLHHSRIETWNHQIEKNKKKWFFIESRGSFIKTMDAIEHEIVNHWMSNDKTMFVNYKDHFRSSFNELTTLLVKHLNTPHLTTSHSKNTVFLTAAKNLDFSNLTKELQDIPNIKDSQALDSTIAELKNNIKNMPKHLRPLAQEIVQQGEQLSKTWNRENQLPSSIHTGL